MEVMQNMTEMEMDVIKVLWSRENNFFNQFQNVSLPLGGLSLDDCMELYSLIGKNHYNTHHNTDRIQIAEIGCWTGLGSILLATIAEKFNGTVYAVDWFQGSQKTNLTFAGRYFNVKNVYDDNLRQFDLAPGRLKVIDKESIQAAKDFPELSLDIVFIDADHRFDPMLADIRTWWPKVKIGGVICGHDCEFLLKNIEELNAKFGDTDEVNAWHPGVTFALMKELPTSRKTDSGKIWYQIKTTELIHEQR